jgi:LEA14-like dessication related protein
MKIPGSGLIGAGLVMLMLLGGCATLSSDFKQPGVSVKSVVPRVVNSITPQFDIVLQITNPNRNELSVKGITYTIHLAGNRVIQGVGSDFPVIAPYGEAEVTLQATADLIGGLGLLGRLLGDPLTPLDYEFNAQIDIGTFYPMINVNKAGVLSLNQPRVAKPAPGV